MVQYQSDYRSFQFKFLPKYILFIYLRRTQEHFTDIKTVSIVEEGNKAKHKRNSRSPTVCWGSSPSRRQSTNINMVAVHVNHGINQSIIQTRSDLRSS